MKEKVRVVSFVAAHFIVSSVTGEFQADQTTIDSRSTEIFLINQITQRIHSFLSKDMNQLLMVPLL